MSNYIGGFDYLRAICSILVVLWHANGLSFLADINPALQNLTNILYYNVSLLAVPVFFQLSLFLFYQKQIRDRNYFLSKKLPDLMMIYGIWMVVGIVINSILSKGTYLGNITNMIDLAHLLVTGSRAELYFLFSLILITFGAFVNSNYLVNQKKGIYIQLSLLCLSLVIIVFFNVMAVITDKNLVQYWNPISFLPYIFSSAILVIMYQDTNYRLEGFLYINKSLIGGILVSIFIFISWLEWNFLYFPEIFGYVQPAYARVSLVFGTFILVYYAMLWSIEPNRLIKVISQESLAIYLLHNYLLEFYHWYGRVLVAIIVSILLGRFMKRFYVGKVMLNARK